MFDDWRQLRKLRHRLSDAQDVLLTVQSRYKKGEADIDALSAAQKEMSSRKWGLQKFESHSLIKRSQVKGIPIPRTLGWWDDDGEELLSYGMPATEVNKVVNEWLTETGIFGARKLFKDERRKTFEWWYSKVIIPTLQVAVPIIALFLVYFSRR